jgi:hypothetical protein
LACQPILRAINRAHAALAEQILQKVAFAKQGRHRQCPMSSTVLSGVYMMIPSSTPGKRAVSALRESKHGEPVTIDWRV